jgi:hypothetical protein
VFESRYSSAVFVYVVIICAYVALWLFAIVDAVRIPESTWTATGRSKIAWVVVLVVLNFACLVYVILIRRSLHDAQRATAISAAVRSERAVDLSSGVTKCASCGFTSNPVGAIKCRSCGAAM